MAIRRRTGLIVVGIAALLLLALIFGVPALINVDRYRPRVEALAQFAVRLERRMRPASN
jgi:hypothetical protein